jgi:hypothetical protein
VRTVLADARGAALCWEDDMSELVPLPPHALSKAEAMAAETTARWNAKRREVTVFMTLIP